MRHSLRRTKDKYHILRFLSNFTNSGECILTIFSDDGPIYSYVFPPGENLELWKTVHHVLSENIGPNSYVR